jgi:precorrin-6B methylase 1
LENGIIAPGNNFGSDVAASLQSVLSLVARFRQQTPSNNIHLRLALSRDGVVAASGDRMVFGAVGGIIREHFTPAQSAVCSMVETTNNTVSRRGILDDATNSTLSRRARFEDDATTNKNIARRLAVLLVASSVNTRRRKALALLLVSRRFKGAPSTVNVLG